MSIISVPHCPTPQTGSVLCAKNCVHHRAMKHISADKYYGGCGD